jgi:hypothetical protein
MSALLCLGARVRQKVSSDLVQANEEGTLLHLVHRDAQGTPRTGMVRWRSGRVSEEFLESLEQLPTHGWLGTATQWLSHYRFKGGSYD